MTWGEWQEFTSVVAMPLKRHSAKRAQHMTAARANALEACAEALRALDAVLDLETSAIAGCEGNMNFEDVTSLNVALSQAAVALAALDTARQAGQG